jgi:hypothetical protein
MDGAHWIAVWKAIVPIAATAFAIAMMYWFSQRWAAGTVRRTARVVAKLGKSTRASNR